MTQLKEKIMNAIILALRSLSYPEKDCSLAPPKNIDFGDLSSNIALLLAKELKKSPMDIAKNIVNELNNNLTGHTTNISITNPGFINFEIDDHYFQSQIIHILNKNQVYGKGDVGTGQTANVEFVSANPTGPLTVGHGRNAILGDAVSNILEWQDFKVTREYYFNDAGRQMRILAQSVEARYFELLGKDLKLPEDGYQGEYIKDIAQIILDENGKDCEAGEQGEVWVSGKHVMLEYWNRPDATAETITSDGWLRTGDVASADEDGFIYIQDRIKDMIISGGENVYPAEIENIILTHPAVTEVAVIGQPSDKWGESPFAVVVKKDESLSEAEVLSHCHGKLGRFKVPRGAVFVEVIPRNANGKVLKRELRKQFPGPAIE